MTINRYISKFIKQDLKEKIVMIGGPGQIGKTTLSRLFISSPNQYLNWDNLKDRKVIKSHEINPELKIIILDEVHKYTRWRSLVKGLYDKYEQQLKIIVTGSAKLDHFKKGGDSLFGRFFYYRLHPFSYNEIAKNFDKPLERLLNYGGFPEPFIKGSETFHRRWQRERLSRVVYQDLNDLQLVKDLGLIELLVDSLPTRASSTISYNNLAEGLEVSPISVKRWVELLEKIYYCFTVMPYGPPKIRAVKKAKKLYLWDWSEVEAEGARFENLVASQLLKYCHYIEDTKGFKMELRYIKDIDGREIDFVVLRNKKPEFAVECKFKDKPISKHIHYYNERLEIPNFYQVHLGEKSFKNKNISVLPFDKFCKLLNLP